MNTLISILFWVGILFIVDGSFGILFREKWEKLAGELDIQRLALLEIAVGFVLLTAHYLLLQGVVGD